MSTPTSAVSGPVLTEAPLADPQGDHVLRAEMYGHEHQEAHARRLAEETRAVHLVGGKPLLKKFKHHWRLLVRTYRRINEACRRKEKFGPDADWLLDNFHIIEDALAEVEHDLPLGYYKLLPKLTTGLTTGYPRVYVLALELITHTDSALDQTNLTRFVQAFQSVAPLTIGELWAVPIMLRLCLLENLRRLAVQIWRAHTACQEATAWATSTLRPENAAARPQPPDWSDAFQLHLLEWLRDQPIPDGSRVEWLEALLAERGMSPADILGRERQRQAANQVTIGNCVTSLRVLSSLDWPAFFEQLSRVELVLRQDPAEVYALQDFPTRDRYRQVVEQLARGSSQDEPEVAAQAVALAQRHGREPAAPGEPAAPSKASGGEPALLGAAGSGSPPLALLGAAGSGSLPQGHVGYYLIDQGRDELEATVGYRPALRDQGRRLLLRYPRVFYFGGLALFTGLIVAGCLAYAGFGPGAVILLLIALAVLLPASEIAVGLVNALAVRLVPPRILPKMAFKDGVPPDCAAVVVMPCMLLRPGSAAALLERLEIHYLSNPDPRLRFALLADFADADDEKMPEDEEYLRAALDGVRRLNERYAAGGPDRFFLCHRKRVWNPVQGRWMGWERKRGKLAEFNRLLRGSTETTFAVVSGDLPKVRYVITLDSDTQLPHESAQRLLATIAHPLNQPRLDARRERVVGGYGVLQPRVGLSLPAANKSWFARLFAGSAGIDPYTTAVSDTYQDLFGLGSFTGKGVYDVDAFEAATGHTFPENHILSHDLIEGNFARCGLVTDIELLDEFPTNYQAYARREHRWARGDWQILPWLFRRVPSATGPRRNPLPTLERWKIFDNLRRSVLPVALLLLFILGWTVLPGSAWFWTGLGLAVLGWPLLRQLAHVPATLGRGLWKGRFARPHFGTLGTTAGHALLTVVFLADQALSLLDAVARTLTRLYGTRRNLLEWESAAATERRMGFGLNDFYRMMWAAPVLAVAVAVLLMGVRPNALFAAAPLLAGWFLSPVVAFWVSRPRLAARPTLTAETRRELRRVARKTWTFFETFVTADDNWLPPDNYQEDPKGVLAHRTSPTNVGLYLLSSLAAHDLGYLSLPALCDRLENTFHTLDRLERWHGHFYNWYETQTLRPLLPIYVSTVDSGNLLACLLALKNGLLEKCGAPVAPAAAVHGLADVLGLLAESVPEATSVSRDAQRRAGLERLIQEVDGWLQAVPTDLNRWPAWLQGLGQLTASLSARAEQVVKTIPNGTESLQRWARQFALQVSERQAEGAALEADGSGLCKRVRSLAERAAVFAVQMDLKVLYNPQRHLFTVGYNLTQGRLDTAHYDLLASEACLTSFLAIARGEAPKRHWFQLGRPLTRAAGSRALLSWGGTMFEYLMPPLLLRGIPETLLYESCQAAVARQIEYGRQCGTPWGISESAFSALDVEQNYQYQAFGVPGLGLQRGLGKDLVVAPYATGLAVGIVPEAAVRNFQALAAEGALGTYGFFEALDYTADRLPPKKRLTAVKCYMAHHQGMILAAITNAVLDDPMPRRLHAEPMVRATELLLQERIPEDVPLVDPHGDEASEPFSVAETSSLVSRQILTPHTPHPRTHLLSNGEYHVLVTNAGAGRSTCRGLDVTRWREDRTRDCWGQFFYVRDLDRGAVWSAGYQPVCRTPDEYEVIYSTDKAEFRRVDAKIETRMEVTVSPENKAEVRRLTFTNHDTRPRRLEVTSYVEIVLGPHAADLAHPAFGKLFLETEFVAAEEALLCRRRPRTPEEKPIWCLHVIAVDDPAGGQVQYETDRTSFLGRGRTPANPAAMDRAGGASFPLSGTIGPVLDPIFSLRRQIRVPPESSVTVTFTTAVADTRDEAVALADRYHDHPGVTRAFELAWAHSQVELRHLHLTARDAHLYQRLAAHVIYSGPVLRATSSIRAANQQGQPGLWRHGISGDAPLVVVRVAEAEELALVRQLLGAHAYWRSKGLEVDLVIFNEHQSGYFEDLQQQLHGMVRTSDDRALVDKPGGVFVRQASHLAREDQVLLQAAASCVLQGSRGLLAAQLDRLERGPVPVEPPPSPIPLIRDTTTTRAHGDDALRFANSHGGFTADGREYVIRVGEAGPPPAPWSNVVANPAFGFLITESGGGCTWAGNSQTNRLTPWSNDPVSDPVGEAVYLRDEESGAFWSPTPAPTRAPGSYTVRHGQGYSVFEHAGQGLAHELLLFVPPRDPVKVLRLKVRNLGRRTRRLSATFYAEWVLDTVRDRAPLRVVTEVDAESGALLARNGFHPDFGTHVAFVDVNVRPYSWTCDRTEFVGRNGSLAAPFALSGDRSLSGASGLALDPCAAVRIAFELRPGEEKTVIFLLGQAPSVEDARRLLRAHRKPEQVERILGEVRDLWDRVLGAVQVRTPDAALDLLVNRWLLYQVLSCRLWGRAAFYQSGGAYGYRDQLQDVGALLTAAPQEARAHLLRAAGRQFLEGDVQHWWHTPSGAGVRTRFSDDYLWLPYLACQYATATGDQAVFDERVPFLSAPLLRPDQEDDYRVPDVSEEQATLYEHCVRAIELGMRVGPHGLPLMGTGDWNDGMNRVGHKGQGESVWNGWFQLAILRPFADFAEQRGDTERAARYRLKAEQLQAALEEHAWDGQWYRRAYFDDGTPLGSAANEECRIDSLAQSWAVLSGAADPERARQAMAAVRQHLVRKADKVILLFTPPFDHGTLEPGYIKGYVPGIRENGGQYTHAAAWVVQAFAQLGDGNAAMELFNLLNPIHLSADLAATQRYRVEPYVVAADVYSEPPHTGRGGWTWYTGSAGWLYRAALESLLGVQPRGNRLRLDPCIADSWPQFEITYRYRSTTYHITVDNPRRVQRGVLRVTHDGQDLSGNEIELTDDGKRHEVRVVLGSLPEA